MCACRVLKTLQMVAPKERDQIAKKLKFLKEDKDQDVKDMAFQVEKKIINWLYHLLIY